MANRRSPLLQIGALRPFRYRSRKKQYGAISHLAVIADNAEVQLRLPQVFLASDKLVGAAAAQELPLAMYKFGEAIVGGILASS